MSFLKRFKSGKKTEPSKKTETTRGMASGSSNTGRSPLQQADNIFSSSSKSAQSGSVPSNPFITSTATRRPQPAPMAGPSDAPPAYTPAIASAPDDPYAFLSEFDTVFLIDDSGSMAGRSWAETEAAISAITPVCTAHDADGIDVHFLNAADDRSL